MYVYIYIYICIYTYKYIYIYTRLKALSSIVRLGDASRKWYVLNEFSCMIVGHCKFYIFNGITILHRLSTSNRDADSIIACSVPSKGMLRKHMKPHPSMNTTHTWTSCSITNNIKSYMCSTNWCTCLIQKKQHTSLCIPPKKNIIYIILNLCRFFFLKKHTYSIITKTCTRLCLFNCMCIYNIHIHDRHMIMIMCEI